MADIALIDDNALTARADTTRRAGRGDARFRFLTWAAAALQLTIFIGVITALVIGAIPAFRTFGFGFITSEVWSPARDRFGAAASIYGTLITSFLAMLVAVPVGIGVAIFLTELCPRVLRRPIGIAIGVRRGFLRSFTASGACLFSRLVSGPCPAAGDQRHREYSPDRHSFGRRAAYGIGVMTAGLILSIMVLPFISAVTRDVFETVPAMLKEATYGLGCTTWEVIWRVVLPFARSGVVGGAMLALGRALGETMAVTFVIGNAHEANT